MRILEILKNVLSLSFLFFCFLVFFSLFFLEKQTQFNQKQTRKQKIKGMFAEKMAPFIETPTISLQSQYDPYQLNAQAWISNREYERSNEYGVQKSTKMHVFARH